MSATEQLGKYAEALVGAASAERDFDVVFAALAAKRPTNARPALLRRD